MIEVFPALLNFVSYFVFSRKLRTTPLLLFVKASLNNHIQMLLKGPKVFLSQISVLVLTSHKANRLAAHIPMPLSPKTLAKDLSLVSFVMALML